MLVLAPSHLRDSTFAVPQLATAFSPDGFPAGCYPCAADERPKARRYGFWRAGADVALERLRCAEGAVRSDCTACPRLSLRDIADPTFRGLRQPRRYENRGNKARMSMKTKGGCGNPTPNGLRCARLSIAEALSQLSAWRVPTVPAREEREHCENTKIVGTKLRSH